VHKELTQRLKDSITGRKSVSFGGDSEMKALQMVMLTKAIIMEATTGLKMSRRVSAWKITKDRFGFKGNKMKVAKQMAQLCFDQTRVDMRGVLTDVEKKWSKEAARG
jgi:hypothetical protein